MDQRAAMLEIAIDADDRRLAVARRGIGQPPHHVRHQRLAELGADVEQRCKVLDVALSGERIVDHRDAGDARDRLRGRLAGFGQHPLFDEDDLADPIQAISPAGG